MADHEPVSVVVLAKERHSAKTRLPVDRTTARKIALRLALHTVSAAGKAGTTGRVFVVTSDMVIAHESATLGTVVVPERRPLGMNKAAELGRRQALRDHPARPVMVLVADLPYLMPVDLEEAVAEFRERQEPLYVADFRGTGTTCLIHSPRQGMGIGFGRDSASLHYRMGYRPATRQVAGLRTDLDIGEDLLGLPRGGPLSRTA